jgi:hypothetical protein
LQLAAAAELYNRDWRYHKVPNISSPIYFSYSLTCFTD